MALAGVVPAWAVFGLGLSGGRSAFWSVVGAAWWLVVARRLGWPEVPWGVFFRAWLGWGLALILIGGISSVVAGRGVWNPVEFALSMGAALGFKAAAAGARRAAPQAR
jgi:hypothetical protein